MFRNAIKPQGWEPFQFPTRNSTLSLRDEVYRDDYRFTLEDKVRLGREVLRRGFKTFGANLILMATIMVALFATMSGAPRFFGLPPAAWWMIALIVFASLAGYLWRYSRCPGCGRSLGGRNTYAWTCIRCGVPLNYFSWRRLRANARALK